MTDTTNTRSSRLSDHDDAANLSYVTPAEDARSVMINNVSWGAVFAGAVIAISVQIVINMLGIGIGASTLDPGTADNPSASAFGIGAAIWFALSAILAALAGGFAAGRLSGKPKKSTAAWHGLTAWAVSTLFVIYLVGSSAGIILGGALNTVGSALSGVTSAASSAVVAAAPADPFAAIERKIRAAAPVGSDPEAARDAAIAAVRTAVMGTEAEAEEARQQAIRALAQAQGITPQQAERQVDAYQAEFAQAAEEAKRIATDAADAAAEVTTTGALIAALMLILGAAAGWFGGQLGAVDPTVTAGRRIV